MNEAYTLERLFGEFPGGICVPRIQRGYVQGRDDAKGMEIQANFVPALVNAMFDGDGLSLDFVYGIASCDGGAGRRLLLPLDGQQRLSTLFLLSWLCGKWKTEWRFDYEARRIPQSFVEGLRQHPFGGVTKPSQEIRDSVWFLPVWEKDPTVAGMLRVLDALHKTIGQRNRANADFGRVTFLLHGIEGQSDTFDHIFRKMNARGKELSPWENMKAMLDKYLPKSLEEEWHDKIDGEWAECIWHHAGGDIANLDNAMEKTIRMAYAHYMGSEAQGDSLWQFEERLCCKGNGDSELGFSLAKRKSFYHTAMQYFREMESIAGNWTQNRTANALWNAVDGDDAFWKWLFGGNNATYAQLLRLAFLSEPVSVGDAARRKRVLLNLLDAPTSIDGGNFAKALSSGVAFLSGKLDLDGLEARKAGYSPAQLADEKRKWKLNANRVVEFEKNELVYCGSLQFIGWSDFKNEADVLARLRKVRAAIDDDWIGFFCKILVRLERGNENELKYRVAIPYDNPYRWGEHVLSTNQVVKAIAEMEAGTPEPEWPDWLQHFMQLAKRKRLGNNYGLRAFDGWTYVVADVSRSPYSIRLDYNANERENRKLLDGEIIYYESGESRWSPRVAKVQGVGYDVWDESWYETTNPTSVSLT